MCLKVGMRAPAFFRFVPKVGEKAGIDKNPCLNRYYSVNFNLLPKSLALILNRFYVKYERKTLNA